jgi:hypothetical protein
MRAGKIVVLTALAAGLMTTPAHAAPHFVVGQGENPGVAVDAAGTAYIGWQVNTRADTGDAVQLCVLPAGARACTSVATIPFPGSGYDVGRVSVLLPAPGVVEVAVGRNVLNVYGYYLATSGDGGTTFGAPVRIGGSFAKRAALLPGGLIAAEGDDVRQLGGAVLRPDGSDALSEGAVLDQRAQFSDVTVQGSDVYIAGSLAGPTTAARLPAGANSVDPAAWQRLPDLPDGNSPKLAPGPAGPVVLLQPNAPGRAAVFVHHWTGAAWSPAVTVGPANAGDAWALAGAGPRLVAAWSVSSPGPGHRVEFAMSLDGGALWSSVSTLAVPSDARYALQAAVTPAGNGVLVSASSTESAPVEVFVIDAHRAKVARARFGTTTVQLRADELDCVEETHLSLRVQAARRGLLVSPASALRSACVRVSRSRVLHRSRWAALVDLRRVHAKRTASVRIVPRHGRARTLRLPVRGCGRVA